MRVSGGAEEFIASIHFQQHFFRLPTIGAAAYHGEVVFAVVRTRAL